MFDNATFVTVQTPRCIQCGKFSQLVVEKAAYQKWCGGMYIQDAFPNMPADLRELLITGTHPECWKKMFSDEDEEC